MLGTQAFLIAAVDDDQEPGLLLRALEYSNNAQIAQNPLFGPVKSIFSGLNHGKQDVKNGLLPCRISTIPVLINFEKMGPPLTAYLEGCFYSFFNFWS